MKYIQLSMMALRYFYRYSHRYIFLFIALSFGFGIITAITSIKAGMEDNIYRSAKSHYAGDMALVGRTDSKIKFQINDVKKVRDTVEKSELSYDHIVTRTQFGSDGIVYYNGSDVRHKYTLGVDWEEEADYFAGLSYSQGQFGNWDKKNGIILSSPVADELYVNVGDSVILEVKTRDGQVNTASLVVQAIIDDSTIFGYYKCYLDRLKLNSLIGFSENEASTIGIYLKENSSLKKEAMKLQVSLMRDGFNISSLVSNKSDLLKEYQHKWIGSRLFVITLPVYLSEVSDLLSAINIIAYFLYFLMLLILFVSVAVTFRLILFERDREIGTLRGIGFHGRDIIFLLVMELVFLFFCSIVTGFLFAGFIVWIMSFLSFSMIPSFEIFMESGSLNAIFTMRTTIINCCIIFIVLFPSVAFPVYKASQKKLSIVLSGGK